MNHKSLAVNAQQAGQLVRSSTLHRILLEAKFLNDKLESSEKAWLLSDSCNELVKKITETLEPFLMDEKLGLNPWTEERWELLDMMNKLLKYKEKQIYLNPSLTLSPNGLSISKGYIQQRRARLTNRLEPMKTVMESRELQMNTSTTASNPITVISTSEENRFYDVPREIWLSIFSFLAPLDIARCRATCRALAAYGNDNQLWMSLRVFDLSASSYEFEKMRRIYETFRAHSKRGNIVDSQAFANVVSANLTKQVLAKNFRQENLFDERWTQVLKATSNMHVPLIMDKLFAFFDQDGDGAISFVDFATGYATLRSDIAGKMKFLFDCFDVDGNGYISKEDLIKFAHAFLEGYQQSQKKIEQACAQNNIDPSPLSTSWPTSSEEDLNQAITELFAKLPETVRLLFREMELATKNKSEKLVEFISKTNIEAIFEWAKENIQTQGRFRKLSAASLSSSFFSSSFFVAFTSGNMTASEQAKEANSYANRISFEIFCLMSVCPIGVLPNSYAIIWVEKVINLIIKSLLGFKVIRHRFQT
jgi:hypothetical protein